MRDIDAGGLGGTERGLRRGGTAALFDIGEGLRIAGQRTAIGRNMHRAAAREYPGEFLVAHARPMSDRADVKMDEPTKKAIAKALEWLARQQNSDGSFSDGGYVHNIAIIGFAMLAFMSQGHLPNQGLYGPLSGLQNCRLHESMPLELSFCTSTRPLCFNESIHGITVIVADTGKKLPV